MESNPEIVRLRAELIDANRVIQHLLSERTVHRHQYDSLMGMVTDTLARGQLVVCAMCGKEIKKAVGNES